MIVSISSNPSLDQILVVRGFHLGGQVHSHRWTVAPGGGAIRVARIAHEIGTPVMATGFVGGISGQVHSQLMNQAGIPHDFIKIQSDTRSKVFVLDEELGFQVEMPGPSPTVTEQEVADLLAKVSTLAGKDDWVVISGSLPNGAPVDMYSTIITKARSLGASTAVDTRGPELHAALRAVPDLWKPNAQEMEDAIQAGIDPVALCENGTTIMLSEGANGVLLFCEGCTPRRFTPPSRQPWNPIGSGSALLAATVAALDNDLSWEEAVTRGLAAGVANMSHDIIGFATGEEIAELSKQVSVSDEVG